MKLIRFWVLFCILFGSNLEGQSGGTITVVNLTTVQATAGSVICTFSNPNTPAVHITCNISNTNYLTEDVTPALGSGNGAVGSFVYQGNNVTWILQQLTSGTVTYQIAANAVNKTGTF